MLTPEQMRFCLDYQTDIDEEVSIVSDKIVMARKDATCCMCGQPAPAGSHHRVETARVDGVLRSCRYCEPCCAAMAVSWQDDGDAVEVRVAMLRLFEEVPA